MTEKNSAQKLIHDYQKLVDEMLNLLKQNVKDRKIDLTNDEERKGILTDDSNRHITYKMHGAGCLFKINNRVVIDVDYAGPRYDGIDYWFLTHYFNSCSDEYPEIKNENHLKELFDTLTSEGYLIKQEHLYYIKSMFHNPKEFEW
jgi:hypothetical protein